MVVVTDVVVVVVADVVVVVVAEVVVVVVAVVTVVVVVVDGFILIRVTIKATKAPITTPPTTAPNKPITIRRRFCLRSLQCIIFILDKTSFISLTRSFWKQPRAYADLLSLPSE